MTRIRTLVWFQCGIMLSGSVHLTKVANKIPGSAKKLSTARRFRRFLDNHAVRVRDWYRPWAIQLLQATYQATGHIRLIIDCSKVGNCHQLVLIAVATRRRALPLAWTWVRQRRGHSSGRKQHAVLAYVQTLIPSDAQVVVVGDSAFTPIQRQATTWGWHYVVRQKGSHLLRVAPDAAWQRCDSLVTRPGQTRWLTHVVLTQQHQMRCHVLAVWQPGETEPWILATNSATAQDARRQYARRMWIEALFGDFKTHGFDLEMTRLRHFARLARLTLAVALVYVVLFAFGTQIIKRGQRHVVDRPDRRDLSVFRIGRDMLDRHLANTTPLAIRYVPYFEIVR